MNVDNFNWGKSNEWYRETMTEEFFNGINIYEKVFKVEEGDIVMDIGASIGPWSYLMKDRKVKHLYCVEPSKTQVEILEKNIKLVPNTIIPYVIGEEDLPISDYWGGQNNTIVKSKKFMEIVNDNNIDKIDFLKTDCEGGEYEIFNIENICWIKENIKKCSGEWHLSNPEFKQKFRVFRDVYLRIFKNYEIFSLDGTNIKWDLWNEHFIEYYNEVIIHIDNR